MTPRRLEADVVIRRLAEMDRLLDDLIAVGPVTAGQLTADRLARHAVERILAALVDLAVAINSHISAAIGGQLPTDYRSSFGAAAAAGALPSELAGALAPSAGLRNAIIHAYLDVDLERIAAAIPLALRDYRSYVSAVAGWLRTRTAAGGPTESR